MNLNGCLCSRQVPTGDRGPGGGNHPNLDCVDRGIVRRTVQRSAENLRVQRTVTVPSVQKATSDRAIGDFRRKSFRRRPETGAAVTNRMLVSGAERGPSESVSAR